MPPKTTTSSASLTVGKVKATVSTTTTQDQFPYTCPYCKVPNTTSQPGNCCSKKACCEAWSRAHAGDSVARKVGAQLFGVNRGTKF